jgi:hypothetical protein
LKLDISRALICGKEGEWLLFIVCLLLLSHRNFFFSHLPYPPGCTEADNQCGGFETAGVWTHVWSLAPDKKVDCPEGTDELLLNELY